MQNYASLQFSQMERPELRLARFQQPKFLPDLENIQRKILARTVRKRAIRRDRYALDKVLVKSANKMI